MALADVRPSLWNGFIGQEMAFRGIWRQLCLDLSPQNPGDEVNVARVTGRATIRTNANGTAAVTYDTVTGGKHTLELNQFKEWGIREFDAERVQQVRSFVPQYAMQTAEDIAATEDAYIRGRFIAEVSDTSPPTNAVGISESVDTDQELVFKRISGTLTGANWADDADGNANRRLLVRAIADLQLYADRRGWPLGGRFLVLSLELAQQLTFYYEGKEFNIGNLAQTGVVQGVTPPNLFGWDLYTDRALPFIDATDDDLIFGGIRGNVMARAGQLSQVEQMRDPAQHAVLIRGLYIYGAEVVKPDQGFKVNVNAAATAVPLS